MSNIHRCTRAWVVLVRVAVDVITAYVLIRLSYVPVSTRLRLIPGALALTFNFNAYPQPSHVNCNP